MPTLTCLYCGIEFESKRATAKYHSDACRVSAARGKGTKPAAPKQPSEKKIDDGKPSILESVPKSNKAELISRMNARLAAKGLPLLSDKPPVTRFIHTGIEALDALTLEYDEDQVGGFPRKHITEVFGPKGSGKTSLMRQIVQNTAGLNVLYIDAENGLISPPEEVVVSYATVVEDVEALVFDAVQSGEYDLVIIDSVAVLSSRKEVDAEAAGMGGKAKAMAQFVRRINAVLRPIGQDGMPLDTPGTAVVFINQLRDTMNSFGIQEFTPGGRSIEYAASLRLELRTAKKDLIIRGSELVGQNVRVKVEKSRFGPRGMETKYQLMYDEL